MNRAIVDAWSKIRVYLSFFFHLGLEILALEAAFLGVCWLLHRYWNLLQHLMLTDVFFFMGALASLLGAAGMMRSPYWIPLSPGMGVWAAPVQATEEEKRVQLIEELKHQKSFGLRALAIGVITILLSFVMTRLQ